MLAIKKPIDAFHNENSKLMERELKNYSMISHPLIPKFYGITECEGYFVIEHIKGQPLDIVVNELTDDEKITIIFELMMIFLYLHKNNLFYRDLKPNNVIIDDNKTAILIDFDRLLEYKPDTNEEQTRYLSSAYVAPEINYRNLSFESDIYSLGIIINFLMNRKGKINHYQTIKEIYELCINENPDERPKITTIIKKMCFSYIDNFKIDHTSNVFDELFFNNAIDFNNPQELFYLGNIYYFETHNKRDINRAIHYFTLAADKNHSEHIYESFSKFFVPEAQYNLGNIYEKGVHVKQDITKAVYYYTQAANQNIAEAQTNLGILYETGRYF